MARVRPPARILSRLVAVTALIGALVVTALIGALVVAPSGPAQAAAPQARCETIFSTSSLIHSATGIFAGNNNRPAGVPAS